MALCANCGHSKEAHWDRYGCQVEGPDIPGDGECCAMAAGPCGCMDFVDKEILNERLAKALLILQGSISLDN